MQQSTVTLRRENKVQATGDKDAAKKFVLEEAVNKDVADEADASTAHNTHNQSGISREKWSILSRFRDHI